jgi:hypothetical protein
MIKGRAIMIGSLIIGLLGVSATKYSLDRYFCEMDRRAQTSTTVRNYKNLLGEFGHLRSSLIESKYANQDAAQKAQMVTEQINSMRATNPEIKQLESDYREGIFYSFATLDIGMIGFAVGSIMSIASSLVDRVNHGTSSRRPSSSLKVLFP